jgi:hypothetical protein
MGPVDSDVLTTSFEYHGDVVSYGPSHENRVEPKPGLPLLVLGVHGRLGRLLVERALRSEHTVTTLSRRPLDLQHPRLRVVKGDALDQDALQTAMRGQQVVLGALGDEGDVTDAAKLAELCGNVAHAMRRYSVHRVSWFVPPGKRAQAEQLREALLNPPPRPGRERPPRVQAPLEWMMVQAHALTELPDGKLYEVTSPDAALDRPVARVDVAEFMLAQLGEPRYVNRAVLLAEVEPAEAP